MTKKSETQKTAGAIIIFLAFIVVAYFLTISNGGMGPSDLEIEEGKREFSSLLSEQAMIFRVVDTGYDPITQTDAFDRANGTNRASASRPTLVSRVTKRFKEPRWIQADGIITPDTPQQFRDFLAELCRSQDICNGGDKGILSIGFNSLGGSLLAGLELGQEVRKRGFRTTVTAAQPSEYNTYEPVAGSCISACAYSFLGGLHRRIDYNYQVVRTRFDPNERDLDRPRVSTLGVHRFRENGSAQSREFASALTDAELFVPQPYEQECSGQTTVETIQCIDAKLLEYTREMGVNTGFFEAAAGQSNSGIRKLSLDELRRFSILTDASFANWEPGVSGVQVFEREAMRSGPIGMWRGIHSGSGNQAADISKIALFCGPQNMRAIAIVAREPGVLIDTQRSRLAKREPWIVQVNNNTEFVYSDQIKYYEIWQNFDVVLNFSDTEWASLFNGDTWNISAFPANQADLPLNQRRTVTAIVDATNVKFLNNGFRQCDGA